MRALDLKALASNTSWMFLERGVRALVGVLVSTAIARLLGPEQYGALAYALAFFTFFQVVVNLGLDGVVVRDLARRADSAAVVLGTSVRMRFCASIASWIVGVGLVVGMHGSESSLVALVAIVLSGLLFQPSDTYALWFQSQSLSKKAARARIQGYLLASTTRVVLVLAGAALPLFAAATLLEAALNALFLRMKFAREQIAQQWKSGVAKALLAESWPLLLSGLAIVMYMRIDQLMLRAMIGERELGIYSVVVPLSEVWNLVPVTVCAGLAPVLAQLRADNDPQYYAILQKAFTALAMTAAGIAGACALGSDQIVALLFGSAYMESSRVLAIHVFALVPVSLGVVQSQWIMNEGLPRLLLYKTVAGALTNICLNLALIPAYGARGAALATVLAHVVSDVLVNMVLSRRMFVMQIRALVGRWR